MPPEAMDLSVEPEEIGRPAQSGTDSPVALSALGELEDLEDEEDDLLPKVAPSQGRRAAQTGEVEKADVSHTRVLLLVIGHALSAACLLVINKWAQKVFPFVWTLTTLQFSFASGLVFFLGKAGAMQVEPLAWEKLVRFFPAAGMFFITITAGNAVVGRTNVDTFIVMRSLVPIPSALLEAVLLKEPYPRPLSWAGLVAILVGAVGYAAANQGMVMGSVAWVLLFLALSPLDAVLIKHIVNSSGLSPWSLVLYNNVCAVVPGMLFSLLLEFRVQQDRETILAAATNSAVLLPVGLSCLTGLSISYFQLNVRGLISSAAFMVLGVSNKFISVLLAQIYKLDANGSLLSLGSVGIAIGGAIAFQQTVKGRGISQAPKTDFKASGCISCTAVVFGILTAAAISLLQQRPAAGA